MITLLTKRLILGALLSSFAVLAGAQGAPIAPAAAESLNLGLAAAQQQEWPVAIRHFLAAQEKDPKAPQILFNLGLATSKLPGWELRSLAWFKLYLRAAPQAANVKQVEQLVAALRVRFESNIGRLAKETVPIARLVAKKSDEFWKKELKGGDIAQVSDFLEIPHVTFLLLDDINNANAVQPRQNAGSVPVPSSHTPYWSVSIPHTYALARIGKLDQAWSDSLRWPNNAQFFMRYLLEAGRLGEAQKLWLAVSKRWGLSYEYLAIQLVCKAQELNQAEIISALKRYVFESVQQECRSQSWLSSEFQTYVAGIAKNGCPFKLGARMPDRSIEFDETRLLEAIDFAKSTKQDELANMAQVIESLMWTTYAYRNIFH